METVKSIWLFFQTQVLGLGWLNDLIGRGVAALGVDIDARIGASIVFFLYDTIKILVLLSVFIFIISYIQSFFPPERTKRIIGRYRGVVANSVAALLGTVTPFCSCSSIPLFIGFTNAGLPVGVTFSFLISSPLVDLGAFLLLVSVFGLKTAAAYVVVGLALAVIGGTIIEKAGMSKYIEDSVKTAGPVDLSSPELTVRTRLKYSAQEVWAVVKSVFFYILGGVAIGALIHNWIPAQAIQAILGSNNPLSVLLAVVVGIPMYADIFGTIPIAEALFAKGVGIGTILAFMMAVTALSLPSIIMLRKAVKPKLLAVFVAIVAVGIVLIGYGFNAFHAFLI